MASAAFALACADDSSQLAAATSLTDEGSGSYYYIPWKPGESETKFIGRAREEFRRQQQIDGAVHVSDRIDVKHLERLVRFQVNGEKYDHIAKADDVDRREVTRQIKAVAALLELRLRPVTPGRPVGTGHPINPNSPHRPQKAAR